MKKLSVSTILNIGSLASFAAFPLLYSAVYGGETLSLVLGLGLIAFSMATPFIALNRGKIP
jgi:hypothetical protein